MIYTIFPRLILDIAIISLIFVIYVLHSLTIQFKNVLHYRLNVTVVPKNTIDLVRVGPYLIFDRN